MKRNTIQNSVVYDMVTKLKSHATADEIYEQVVKEYPHISRGTVYRNLNKLCEMGKIRKREIVDGPDCFDHLCHNHYHVKCIKCSRVFDVDMKYIEDIEKYILDTHGFIFTGHDIMFKAICSECKENTSK